MTDVLPPQAQRPGERQPLASGVDVRTYPCPPVFASDVPSGARTIRYGTGAAGLTMIGARARTHADRDAFRVSMAVARFGVLNVCHARHTAMLVPRQGNNFGHPQRTVRLLIMLTGEATLRAGGRTVVLGPGGGAVTCGWEEYVYESTSTVTRVHVDIPADVPPFAAALSSAAPLIWPGESPVLLTAGAALVEMIRCESGMTDFSTRDGLRRMAEAVTLSVLGTPPSDGGVTSSAVRLRARVLSHIASHHCRPELNASTLAADLGLSTRSLQRLFAGEVRGVAEEIAAARLNHALALLRDPLLQEASLEEIATRTGFGSVARMRRAIRAATGLCPREFRERSGTSDARPDVEAPRLVTRAAGVRARRA